MNTIRSPIKSPTIGVKPGTSSPRKRLVIREANPSVSNSPLTPLSPTKVYIEDYLDEKLSKANSDAERIYAYQCAFDRLLNEFQVCRPIVERIKQQYDNMVHKLLERKMNVINDTIPASIPEDHYSELISELRRAKMYEFTNRENDANRKIEELTILRSKLYEMYNQIAETKKELSELKNENEYKNATNKETQSRISDLMINTSILTAESNTLRQQINSIKSTIDKVHSSIEELHINNEVAVKQLVELEKEEEIINTDIISTKQKYQEITDLLKNRKADNIEKEITINSLNARLDSQKNRLADLENSYRKLTHDTNTPIEQLITKAIH